MALFSKRHYEAIASALRKEFKCAKGREAEFYTMDGVDSMFETTQNIRDALCDLFHHDNPAFNRDRFLKASGTQD